MKKEKLRLRSKHDTGIFYVIVNNNPDQIIKWSLKDSDLITNADKLTNTVFRMIGEWTVYLSTSGDDVNDFDSPQANDAYAKIRNEFGKVFGTGSFDILFMGKHPFYSVGTKIMFTHVMEKLLPHLRKFHKLIAAF